MKVIGRDDLIKIEGKVRVCGFEPGLLQELLTVEGMRLREAMATAERMGGLKFVQKTHNLVTMAGKQFIARRISGQESAGLSYFALGTGNAAPAISDTQLGAESVRKLLTECYQGDTFVYSSCFFLASECSFHILEGGLFGGAAAGATANSGSMLARFLIDEDNSVHQYDLTFQHTFEVK